MIVLTRAKFLLLILLLLALLSGGLLAGIAYRDPIVSWLGGQTAPETTAHDPVSSTPGEREVLYWYDPMHPQYSSVSTGPTIGICAWIIFEIEAGSMSM